MSEKKQETEQAEKQVVQGTGAKAAKDRLSNKNKDYLYRLRKALLAGGMSESKAEAEISKRLPEILEAQVKGQPANVLYGASPKVLADRILHPEVKPQKVPVWIITVDGGLIYTAILTLMFGLIQAFSGDNKSTASGSGILTLLIMGIGMGWFFSKYESWIQPSSKNGKTSWGKVIGAGVGSIVALILVVFVLSLPALQVINPVLPGWADLIVAAAAYGLRWLLRRHYGIEGSSFTPSTMSMKKPEDK